MSKSAGKQTNQPMAGMEVKKWRTIYPQYINSNLTIDLGRRLAKSKCVPNPTLEEIFQVLQFNTKFEIKCYGEKCYCREEDKENPKNRGYIKYICNDPTLKNKRAVLVYIAQLIPKLKSRVNPKPTSDGKAPASTSAPSTSSSTSNTGSGGGKKKNRRK